MNKGKLFYTSHYPIQLDSTCNGFQHIAMLMEDAGLAKAVSIEKQDTSDAPDDLYSFITMKVNEDILTEITKYKCDEN